MWKTIVPAAAVLAAEAVIRRKINALPAETFPLRIGQRVQLRRAHNRGLLCSKCHATYTGEGLEPCAEGTRRLWQWLAALDYESPTAFSVRGGDLMELERILYKFIFFQTDKPLNSLNFLSQMGL